MKAKYIFIIAFSFFSSLLFANNAEKKLEIGIDEKLGNQIPLETEFYDEQGYLVSLKDVITKPTIVAFVYFDCPGICTPILNEITTIVNHLDLEIGRDYQIVTVSFDETEKPELAASKKKSYFGLLKKDIPQNSWKFLTGDSVSIRKFTNAAGFMFKRDKGEFLHVGAITILSPEGKVARYLYGTQYLPFDVKMAITEASEGKTGPTIAKLLKLCYAYDPAGQTYTLNVTRISGGVILLLVTIFVIFFIVKPKKVNQNTEVEKSKK